MSELIDRRLDRLATRVPFEIKTSFKFIFKIHIFLLYKIDIVIGGDSEGLFEPYGHPQ